MDNDWILDRRGENGRLHLSFPAIPSTHMTRFTDPAQAAYSVQDYTGTPMIEGVEIVQLRRFNDDGGAMTELGRLDGGLHKDLPGFQVRQVNYSVVEPSAIKAFHLHKRQTDVWYVPPSDKILLVLADVREGSKTKGLVRRIVLGDCNSRLVRIPPGVAHGCKNLRVALPSTIIYFVDVQFSTDTTCDEGRLPWDHFGAGVWEVERG
jgi:dTDP-4-dehydrorhamnose 3,5-epimerase-like enzyme